MYNNPLPLTKREWKEIAKIKAIREAFGIDDPADEKSFAENVFAVRFNYMSDCPGYVGDLFVLMGGMLECPAMVIARINGKLEVLDSSKH